MALHRFDRTILAELAAAALLVSACNSLFGIDEPKPSPPERPTTGGSGEPGGAAGEGGAPGGAGGETTGGAAGKASGGTAGDTSGGTHSGRGGASAGAETGGRGGDATGGAGVGGGGGGEDGGGGGEDGGGNPPDWPAIGGPCETAGALSCPGPAASQTLVCNGERWGVNQTCGEYQRCDRRSGSCGDVVCETTRCLGDRTQQTCGPDLLSTTQELCILGCDEITNSCREPVGDELILDQPPAIESAGTAWPDPAIPVCVHDANRYATEWSAIRAEVESTWGRISALVFTGWGECHDRPSGIELRMAAECDHELVRVERYGYPGPSGVVPVTFCTSYYDSRRAIRQTELPLFRFVARHAFGDVLGMGHFPSIPTDGTEDFRQPWLRVPAYQNVGFSLGAAVAVQWTYGHKLPHSFVSGEGRCLSLSSGEFTLDPCDGAPERAFRAESGRLQHVATETCVRAGATPGAVESGDCAFGTANDPAVTWEPRRVTWHGWGDRCVTVHPDAVLPDTVIVLEPCEAGRDDQTWSFELAGGGVRILHPSSGYCVSAPETWPSGLVTSYPTLSMSCGTSRDLFEARDGQLSVDRRCLDVNLDRPNGEISFQPCGNGPFNKWNLSGPFQNPAGDALTLANGVLIRAPVASPPTSNQIFDYHF